MHLEPFTVAVDDRDLRDLRDRLRRTRWPDASPAEPWEEGTDLTDLARLVHHGAEDFDWRAQEAVLNRIPQFTTQIDGLRVHLLHVRGVGPAPHPLVLGHGWPGTGFDLRRILPLLTDPGAHGADPADAFDVVVPSLPGYGFSQAPDREGFGPERVAAMWTELMTGLGYDRFGVQAADWGAAVGIWLAQQEPERLSGMHLNFLPGLFRPALGEGQRPLSEDEQAFSRAMEAWFEREGGYHRLQSTRPQTPAYALTDSPAGLAGWIVEKLRGWSDSHGDLERVFSPADVLTTVSLFWFTRSIAPSMRFYRENALRPNRFAPGQRVTPPLGFAAFPAEPAPPREFLERVFDVRRYTRMPAGGHFGAWEDPQALATEVRAFFRPLRGA